MSKLPWASGGSVSVNNLLLPPSQCAVVDAKAGHNKAADTNPG